MARKSLGGQLGKIADATAAPTPRKASPTDKGDAALVNRSIQTTRERWKQLRQYALEHDIKLYEAVEQILAAFFDKPR